MKAGEVEGVVGEGLSIELDQGAVPLLGELPHYCLGYFHFLKSKLRYIKVIIKLPYLIAKNLTSFEMI